MSVLSAADKAWMNTTTEELILEWNTTADVYRLVLSGVTGQSVYETLPHLTGVKVAVGPAGDTVFMDGAPAGKPFEAFTKHYTVPTQIMEGDLFVLSTAEQFKVAAIQDYPSHLRMLFLRYVPELTS